MSLSNATPNASLSQPPAVETDALIIGAGPAGLFQAFQLGLQGIHAHLIDALPHIGGQCSQLYGHKPIYDVPGIPVCTGQELVQLLAKQIAPMNVPRHLDQQVQTLEAMSDGRWHVSTSAGSVFNTRTVFIAAGVGAFVPKTLKVSGIELLAAGQLHYHPHQLDMAADRQVLVYGGDEEAVSAAIHCASTSTRTWLMHRRDSFNAEPDQLAQLQQLRESGAIEVLIGQITELEQESGLLKAVQWMDGEGNEYPLPIEQLLVFQGISPKLGPLTDWGLALERKQLVVDPATQATSVQGIYAIGDIVSYPGKKRLILCAFHEATMAAFAAAEHLQGSKPLLEYTTTSARLHSILGVSH